MAHSVLPQPTFGLTGEASSTPLAVFATESILDDYDVTESVEQVQPRLVVK
jgi:hypothetical protein